MTENTTQQEQDLAEMDYEEHLAVAEALSMAYLVESDDYGWAVADDDPANAEFAKAAAALGRLHIELCQTKYKLTEEARLMEAMTRPTTDHLGLDKILRGEDPNPNPRPAQ